MQITYERVRELFTYNGKDLFWKITTNGRAPKGRIAGNLRPDGYRQIRINRKHYYAHRIIWLYKNGYMPEHLIDHINRNPSDNRIENLREITGSCNIRNSGNPKNNASGVKGVRLNKKNKIWVAEIYVVDKTHYLGESKDFNEAVLLRLMAEQCLNWSLCDSNTPARKYAIGHGLFKPPTF